MIAAAAVLLASVLVPLPLAGAEAARHPVPVIDLHVDLSYQHHYKRRSFARGTGQYPATELARAGVAGLVLPLYVPRKVSPEGPRLVDLQRSYQGVLAALRESPVYAPPGCGEPGGKVRTWLAFEGAAPLAQDPSSVSSWAARGVRLFGLVHTYNNALAGSSGDAQGEALGLTEAGREVVQRVHAAGALVDVSHASDRAVDEVVAAAKRDGAPVVATHSNARALADHPRNLTDSQLRAIASTGGVVGVNFHGPFLARGRAATLTDVVRHIRHIIRVAGPEHVALGSDFEGDIRPPPELRSAKDFPRLARALEDDGLSRDQIERVFHANARRLLCAPRAAR